MILASCLFLEVRINNNTVLFLKCDSPEGLLLPREAATIGECFPESLYRALPNLWSQ